MNTNTNSSLDKIDLNKLNDEDDDEDKISIISDSDQDDIQSELNIIKKSLKINKKNI